MSSPVIPAKAGIQLPWRCWLPDLRSKRRKSWIPACAGMTEGRKSSILKSFTASRAPVEAEAIGVSATVIDERRLEALGEVQAVDLLRLVPGVTVSVGGSRGTQTQLRIRGG